MTMGYMNAVDIVSNTPEAIQAAIDLRCPNNWNLGQLVDKPATNEVYLVWSKLCIPGEQAT